MVAERSQVEAKGVQDGHHLFASEALAIYTRRTQRRGAEEVAGDDGVGIRILREKLFSDSRHASETTLTSTCDRRDFIHVVELQDRERNGRIRRRYANCEINRRRNRSAPGEDECKREREKPAHGGER